MTVSTNDNKIIYTGNGTTVTFPVPFLFYDDAHVVVRTKKDETVTDCVRGVDYSIAGAWDDNGGTVTFFAAPDDGTQVAILRDVPFVQNTQYLDGDPLPAELLEHNLDVLTMQTQQLKEQSDRAVTVDFFSNSDPSQIVGKIEGLYDDRDKLITVAEHIAAVDVCSDNIEAIRDAPNQAAAASASASAATLAEAGAADSRDKAAASESSAVVSRDKAAASENKAREYALQAVRRNVGDVFYTTRSDDALNGAVEADGAVYQCADFAGENAVPALLAAGKLPYVSMAEYDELLRSDPSNGVCHECVVSDGGLISARSGGWFKPTLSDIPFSVAESWEFETRLIYKNFGGATWRAILATGDPVDFKNPFLQISTGGVVCAWLSSNGTSWNLANQVNTGLTLADGTEYRLKFGFDGAYYLKYKTPTDADFVTKWSLAKTDKIVNAPSICLLNTLSSASLASTCWNGSQMSLPDTALTVDGVEVWRGGTGKEGALSCRVFGWDGAGAATFRVPKAEKPKRVLVAEKKPSADSQNWWELYSDGWLVQGGYSAANSVHEFCRLEKPYRDVAYTVVTVSEGGLADYIWSGVSATPKTVDSFQFSHRYAGRYVAYGYAAVPPESEWQFQNVETHRAMVQLVTGATDDAVATATGVLPRMNRLEERFRIVSALPENPDPETFYFVVKGD